MELLPTCSQKYCKIFEKEFVSRSSNSQTLLTFDIVTENLHMFDSTEMSNWSILANAITLMISDVIAVILDPSVKGAPIFVAQETTSALLRQMKHYCKMQVVAEDEESSEGPYSKELYA
jgi:hypothetical protein